MAGADYNGGQEAPKKSVPSMGSLSGSAEVAGGGHTEGTAKSYPEAFGGGPDGKGYPSGTDFGEANNPLRP